MNTYAVFYRATRIEVEADDMIAALDKAVAVFKPRRASDIHLVLLRVDGRDIVQHIGWI